MITKKPLQAKIAGGLFFDSKLFKGHNFKPNFAEGTSFYSETFSKQTLSSEFAGGVFIYL